MVSTTAKLFIKEKFGHVLGERAAPPHLKSIFCKCCAVSTPQQSMCSVPPRHMAILFFDKKFGCGADRPPFLPKLW